jgi:predicted ATP-grasp superfamily ATP-dependent carboligase
VLIAGVSTRAAAESAARAGFRVTAIDAFADLDQHPSVTAHALPKNFSAHAAARAAREISCDAVVYLSNFENHRKAVARLAAGRTLWGNPPAVLQRVRDPLAVAHAFARRGFAVPAVLPSEPRTLEPWNPGTVEPGTSWLVKPVSSGGGRRIRRWRAGARVPRGCYLQQLVEGVPGSVVFVAAGGRAVPLGVSWQLIGEPAFGAAGYRYCGNILTASGAAPVDHDEAIVADATALCRAAAEEFGLVGVNGIDFVARNGVAYTVEVNPRWSASMELVERAYGVSVFRAHAAACADGVLPEFDLSAARHGAPAVGKAVVFARRDVVVGDTETWLPASAALPDPPDPPALPDLPGLRDIPHPGERILAGRPVCTVMASGTDRAACHAALVRLAEQVFGQLSLWEREIA